ncbi:hypothetical protein SPONN_350 [uncultured Candidatus Thioglobus sp.]|nr:hypothetical protein SPONN_350 [uncultured Candidatus Thioglobus sp.]
MLSLITPVDRKVVDIFKKSHHCPNWMLRINEGTSVTS